MPRLYIKDLLIIDNTISITGEKARYLTSVLRCGKGDKVLIYNGEGRCLKTKILRCGRKEVVTEILEVFNVDTESNLNIVLGQSLLKGEKMDLIIQKTTELGVKEIVPLITERSQIRRTRKIDRWRKIAEEASRQSGRNIVPVIREPVDIKNIFNTFSTKDRPHGIIFYEEEGMKISEAVEILKRSFEGTIQNILVVIGPEGGFTKQEIEIAKERGLIITSLGKRILRAETAAISAIAVIQFAFGDMN